MWWRELGKFANKNEQEQTKTKKKKKNKKRERKMSDNITNNVVFVGNPGTGKSTLLNGLIGKVEFESGVSFGEGLTQRLQRYTHTDGTVYMDTPGLDDIKSKKEAAAEIEAALRSGGSFRIFFLVLLDSGFVCFFFFFFFFRFASPLFFFLLFVFSPFSPFLVHGFLFVLIRISC